jgi:hypothetical protein
MTCSNDPQAARQEALSWLGAQINWERRLRELTETRIATRIAVQAADPAARTAADEAAAVADPVPERGAVSALVAAPAAMGHHRGVPDGGKVDDGMEAARSIA